MTLYLYVQYFPPHQNPVHNGVIKAVHGLAAGLAACGESVMVLSEGPQSATVQTAFGYVHCCFARTNNNPSFHLAPDLSAFIRRRITGRDLVILNGGFHPSVYACAQLLISQAIPYVMAPHLSYDDSMFAKSRCRKHVYWHLWERHVLRSARVIQVFDQRQATWLKRRGINTPTIEVPNGFDSASIPPRSTLSWRSASAPVQLLFFGRLCSYIKGLDFLLQAFAGLPDRSGAPHPELILQGPDEGDRSSLIQSVRRLRVSDRVHFRSADYVTPPTQIMAEADIICLTSRSEGFGLAALEGMLAGRVLLVTETTGIAKHVQASGCGVVVQPNVESIQAGLNWLLQCRDDWPEMGLRGRQQAIDHLPWSQIAQQVRPKYHALIDRHRPEPELTLSNNKINRKVGIAHPTHMR
jgi:glycosyltransferase involved in cell wall biosynthesis